MISHSPSAQSIHKFKGPTSKSLKVDSNVRLLAGIHGCQLYVVKYAGGATLNDYKAQYEGNDAGFKRFHPDIYA